MSRRGSGKWRWAAVALLIAALGTSVAIFLHTAGLSGAANFAQLLTLVFFIPPAVNWARSKTSSEQHRSLDAQPTLPDQEATARSPQTENLDADETRRSRSEPGRSRSPEQNYISSVYENRAEIGGAHSTPKPPRWDHTARRWAWPILALVVLGLIPVWASLQTSSDGSTYTVPTVTDLPVGRAIAEIKANGLVPSVEPFPFCLT